MKYTITVKEHYSIKTEVEVEADDQLQAQALAEEKATDLFDQAYIVYEGSEIVSVRTLDGPLVFIKHRD